MVERQRGRTQRDRKYLFSFRKLILIVGSNSRGLAGCLVFYRGVNFVSCLERKVYILFYLLLYSKNLFYFSNLDLDIRHTKKKVVPVYCGHFN
jgi:hypothetical protein